MLTGGGSRGTPQILDPHGIALGGRHGAQSDPTAVWWCGIGQGGHHQLRVLSFPVSSNHAPGGASSVPPLGHHSLLTTAVARMEAMPACWGSS